MKFNRFYPIVLFLFTIISLSLPLSSYAQEEKKEDALFKRPDFIFNLQFAQKYMSANGHDFNGDRATIHPEIIIDFGKFYAGIWGAFPIESRPKWEEFGEWDFYVGYKNSFAKDHRFEIAYDINYFFIYFPELSPDLDTHEINLALKFPRLISIPGPGKLLPYINTSWDFANNENSRDAINQIAVRGGLRYTIESIREDTDLSFYAHTVYNDGQNSRIDNGLTHGVIGTELSFKLGPIDTTLGVHYQDTWDATVNPEDDFWTKLGFSFVY
ncbi:hypothetical protein ACQZV8_06575 [Magnetococcales bacterium HHB-1]